MPIDVSILSQFKPQQPEPLLNTLAQFETIRGARQQQEMNALQMQQARRQMEEQEFENKLYQNALTSGGDVDYAAARQRAAAGGFGRLVPVLTKREQEEAKARAAATAEQVKLQAEQNKLLTDKITQYGDAARFIETPEAARAWNAALHEDKITGPWFKSIGVTREQGDQEILAFAQAGDLAGWRSKVLEGKEKITQRLRDQSDLQRAMAAAGKKASPTTDVSLYDTGEEGRRVQTDSISYIQNVVAELQELGRTDLAGTILKQYMDSAMAPYAGLPPGAAALEALRRHPELFDLQRRLNAAGASTTSITNVIESEFGKAGAKKIISLVDQAPQAFAALNKARETISLIDQGITSGFAAEFRQDVDRMMALFKGKTPEQVVRTDLVSAFLGADVYQMMSAFNLGAKNIDSAAEQKYLAKVLTGTIALDKAALQRMTKLRADAYQDIVEQYNEKLANGELDKYMQATGAKLKPINVPPRVNTDADFERLKKTKPSGTEFVGPDGRVRRLR